MDEKELTEYLHAHIPLSAAMAAEVRRAGEDGVTLFAPLPPNINHRETVFGGSASALAILAAWTLLHVRLTGAKLPSRVVIQRNTMNYDAPINGDFTADAIPPEAEEWAKFERMLRRRGRARITVCSVLRCDGADVGRLEGVFVAFQ